MTGLLSDLKPQSSNWVEFHTGVLNFRQPAQKHVFSRESRASGAEIIGFVQCQE